MSFGSPFGGFGANNNTNNQQPQQQGTGFAGFGANNTNNNTTGGFGTSTTNTGFGSNNNTSGGSLFGGGTNNAGSSFGGFGANNNTNQQSTPFGQPRPFGSTATTGSSLFGGNTSTAGTSTFGGFGNTANNTATNTGFGSNAGGTSGGSLFGNTAQTNTGFGTSTPSAGGGLFGSQQNQGTGFGGTSAPAAGGPAFGGASQPQNNGTGGTPFTPHTERDPNSSNQTQQYQSITCQPQYQNFQFEELRAVDYNQGRKYGNQSGQAGAFGANTGFGGFGQTNTNNTNNNTGFGATSGGSLFGQPQNQNQSQPFGAASSGTGFGNNNSLFAPKPATTNSLFGNTTATSGSNMFGSTGNSGFGANNNTGFGNNNNNAGGGLFGSNNNQKPGGLFGQPASTNNAFGTSTNTGGFGATQPTGSLFGNNQPNQQNTTGAFGQPQQGAQSGGLFGQTQNQNQNNTQSGGLFGGGAFGTQNQQKPSLFGNTSNTGGGLFGANNNQQQQQPQQGGGLFGQNNSQPNQTNSLFGQSTQAKPSLFGNTQTNNTGGGLFGAQNNTSQPNQGNSLFSSTLNQPKPSLFGSSTTTNNNGGGGLFGGLGQNTNNQQNAGSSLFGNNNQNQQQPLGSSLFGNTQNQQQQQQQQAQPLTTSIMSNNPYGNDHLFVNLGTPSQSVGPLITPLSSSQKARKPAPLPTHRLNPLSSSRLFTPQKRSGYGFDYSAYGTPGSAYSNATPPMYGRGLLGSGSIGRTLGRSLSATNLRGPHTPEESILAPGAFSTGGMNSGSGNMKKLKINRGLRTDLFGADRSNDPFRASPLKKTVSFEASGGDKTNQTNGESTTNAQTSSALVRVEETDGPTPSAEEQGYLRSSRRSQPPAQVNGTPAQAEMEQVQGRELAVVPEDSAPRVEAPAAKPAMSAEEAARLSQKDMEPGTYYMVPSRAEIEKMSRRDRASISPFTVGRENTGKIEFDKVDLSGVDLDKIMGDIVQITQRSATVYPNHANKPPEGKGLNFPARITLDNSWPRSKGGKVPVFERKGPRFEKHLERLKRVAGTEFEQYVVDKGQWIFRVPHFSTYALDYSDDESMLSRPATNFSTRSSGLMPRLSANAERSQQEMSLDNMSDYSSNIDDTFEFRTSKSVPGAFEPSFISDEEPDLPRASNAPASPEMSQWQATIMDDVQPHSSPFNGDLIIPRALDGAMDDDSPERYAQSLVSPIKPKSILKNSRLANPKSGSPATNTHGNWASHLQKSLSPKKQNRQTLRDAQNTLTRGNRLAAETGMALLSKEKNPFATSIDVMNSLFGQAPQAGRQTGGGKGFQWPYAKRNKLGPNADMSDSDRAFHKSFKPSWAFDGTFIYSASGPAELGINGKARISFEGNDNEFGCFAAITPGEATSSLREQQSFSGIMVEDGCPRVHTTSSFNFSTLANVVGEEEATTRYEKLMWRLASALFDSNSSDGRNELQRKKDVSDFWTSLVRPLTTQQLEDASKGGKDSSEIALIQLSAHDIAKAVASLVEGKNFRLSTMIAQIGGNETMRNGFATQIEDWRRTDTLSEISPAIRSLYELLAGNTCTAVGKSGVGAENKAETFNISSRFGLDWRQSFGLKLWYGKLWEEDSLADVVKAYAMDIATAKDQVKPFPWFLQQDINTGWDDPRKEERQDILLGLLKIYAHALDPETPNCDLADIISPQNVSGNPTDARLSFQLYQTLSAKQIIDFPEDEREHKADLLATDYAFQLSATPESLFDAIFVILHLSEASARAAAVKALLNRHAGAIEDTRDGQLFSRLVDDLQIPAPWIWAAKALYAKAILADACHECYCLLQAGNDYLSLAHDTLCRVLAPKCIIEEDTSTLRDVLKWFEQLGTARFLGWETGGGMYAEYLRLLDHARHGDKAEMTELVRRLQEVLAAVGKGALSLDERVAVTEMAAGIGRAVEEVAWRTGGSETLSRSTAPPKTLAGSSDATLKQAMKLTESYYSSVRVGGQ